MKDIQIYNNLEFGEIRTNGTYTAGYQSDIAKLINPLYKQLMFSCVQNLEGGVTQ